MITICTRALLSTAIATIGMAIAGTSFHHLNVPTQAGQYVANADTMVYHLPSCPQNPVGSRVAFQTQKDAQEAGYRPCRCCFIPDGTARSLPPARSQ